PVGTVLGEKPLIGVAAAAVGLGIAPAEQEIAPFAALAPLVRGRFLGARAMVDHPHFVELVDAEHDLIELRVVRDRVHVHPIAFEGPPPPRPSPAPWPPPPRTPLSAPARAACSGRAASLVSWWTFLLRCWVLLRVALLGVILRCIFRRVFGCVCRCVSTA